MLTSLSDSCFSPVTAAATRLVLHVEIALQPVRRRAGVGLEARLVVGQQRDARRQHAHAQILAQENCWLGESSGTSLDSMR